MTRGKAMALTALISMAAACSGDRSDGTEDLATASTAAPGDTTSTALPETDTTTSTAPSTTLAGQLPGDWADQPLITYPGWGGMALGWWDGSSWVNVDESTVLPIVGGEDYQIALLGLERTIQGGPQHNRGCDVVLTDPIPGVDLGDDETLSVELDEGGEQPRLVTGVAISAPWELQPRPVGLGESRPDLEETALSLLGERDYSTDSAAIVQVVDGDLDGDGAIETIVVAEDTELGNEGSDVYSVVFAVSPAWTAPIILDESVIPATEVGYPASFRVSAVADLSGDGTMEVVLDGLAWESSWVAVYVFSGTAFDNPIGAGCGV